MLGLGLHVGQLRDVVIMFRTPAATVMAQEVAVQRRVLVLQHGAEAEHEVVVAIPRVTGERGDHQLALEAGDIDRGSLIGV